MKLGSLKDLHTYVCREILTMTNGRIFVNKVIDELSKKTEGLVYEIGKHPHFNYAKLFKNGVSTDISKDAEPDVIDDICHSKLDGNAELIIFVGIYEYLEKPELAFKEMHRLLKDGGMLLAALPGTGYWQAPGELGKRIDIEHTDSIFADFKIERTDNFYAPNGELECSVIRARK